MPILLRWQKALITRAELGVETTANAALAGGDVDGAFVAAYAWFV
jgi:hypothetical protein